MRNAPWKARPKPAPATVVPARKAADALVAIAPNVTATPASNNRQPVSIAARELMPRSAYAATAPVPQTRNITSPPQIRFGEPVAAAASDGPSDRKRPPSAQVATRHGIAPAKVPRAWRGTATAGRSEARTPGRRDPGSAMASTAMMPTANTASSAHQIRWVGAGAYWASALVISAPRARPRVEKALVTSGARWLRDGCRSISAAPIGPVASQLHLRLHADGPGDLPADDPARQVVQQRALAHARLAPQDGDPAPAGQRVGQELVEHLTLAAASEELGGRTGILTRRRPPCIVPRLLAAGISRAYIGDHACGTPQTTGSPRVSPGGDTVAGAQECTEP